MNKTYLSDNIIELFQYFKNYFYNKQQCIEDTKYLLK
jgi:hypothetical protein